MARVGEHPIFPELLSDALELAVQRPGTVLREPLDNLKTWDGAWFADRCCGKYDALTTELLLAIQRREWALLFDYNFGKAFA